MKRIFQKILLAMAILLIFGCNFSFAESQPETTAKKGIIPNYFEKFKNRGKTYKTKLELKYYQELFKKNPNDIPILESYGKFLKDHQYYNEASEIYKKLFDLTKNEKYKDEIAKIKSIKKFEDKNKKFQNYIKQAQNYEAKGEIKKAHEEYLKAQKLFPDRYEAVFGLAKTHGWLKQQKKAAENYQILLKQFPDDVGLLESYAEFLKINKNYADVAEVYNKLFALTKNEKYNLDLNKIILQEKASSQNKIKSDKNSKQENLFSNYIKQAQDYEKRGKIKKANEYYLKAQKISSEKHEVIFGLAKTYGWLGNKQLALGYYKELLEKSPDNVEFKKSYEKFLKESKEYKPSRQIRPSFKYLTQNKNFEQKQKQEQKKEKLFLEYIKQAQVYENQGNVAKANEFYQKAEKMFPKRYEPKFGLAKTYGWLHKDDLALKYYQELLKQSPDNVDLLESYAAYLKAGKSYSQSLDVYNKLFEQTKNEKYNADIAEIFFLQQKYETSLKLYQEIYSKNPNNPETQREIAFLYFLLGDFKQSVDFYQKYLAQKQDKESLLTYGKSLFYSKQIQPAKIVLENYVKSYPDDVEGLSTLADLYSSLNNNKQATALINKAVSLEPNNIKFKIQSAKINISTKNYTQAKNILFKLYQAEPKNPEVLENIGDVYFFTGDFKQALKYYQCIPDFQNNKRIKFKIAQANHYNKNIALGEKLYKEFLNDPEYINRAKIGIAEIQIMKNKPLDARRVLNNVLQNDPKNIQALKNKAITYYSTQDNFQSIEIFEKMPMDDSDVRFNFAKAYNAIERKDLALDLLKDNPQDNAKILKEEISMQIRPAIEPIYHLYKEVGDANAGTYQKFGGNGYLYLKPNLRAVGSIITANYWNRTNIQTTWGTLYSVGLEGRPFDKLSFKSAIGIEQFSNNGNLILGNGTVKYSPNDFISVTSGYVRSLDEIDSYMSAAGVIPTTGPFAGQLVGRIVDNKFIVANIALKLPYKSYLYAGFNLGNKYGGNSPTNQYREIPAGIGKVFYSAAEDKHINQVLVGYDFYYTGYDEDRSGFGGANLNYSPVGSDGGPINPIGGAAGTGGYFSPTFFIANKIPITLKGSFPKWKLKYFLSAFWGTQTIDGATGLVGGSSGMRTTPYYGLLASLIYNENGKYGARVDYSYNNYMEVEQNLFKVSFLIRF